MTGAPRNKTTRRWADRNHPAYLMLSLFLLILVQPAAEGRAFAGLMLSGLLSLVLLSSALSVLRSRRLLLIVCVLAAPPLVLNWLARITDPGGGVTMVGGVLLAGFAFFVAGVLVRNVLASPVVTSNTLRRAVSAYLLIGIAWAGIYQVLALADPGSIPSLTRQSTWGDFAYFSFTVLTTLGFGDVTPASPFARSLTVLEAVVGPLYLAVLVARLVAMYRPSDPK